MNVHGVTFETLGETTGIPSTSLNEYTRGMRAIRLETAIKIVDYFGKSIEEMVTPLKELDEFENQSVKSRQLRIAVEECYRPNSNK